jgi:hypothetical protein
MSQRDRPAPRGRQPGDRPVGRPGTPVAWDDLYDRLPPGARARLITAAADTGVVPAADVPADEPSRNLLHRLLAADGVDDLAPLDAAPIDGLPADLDPQQRAAVALALRTPDVGLVQGLPGTGKSRVAAEAVALAARRGERVLLIAPDPAALDRVLELLADRPEVCPLRCLDKDEADVPPVAAGCTFAAHTRRLTEQARDRARARVEAAVAACRRRDAEAAVYDHLLDLAEQHHRLTARRGESTPERNTEYSAVSTELAARRADGDRARRTATELEPTLAVLRPQAAARAAGRWWTPGWWRAGGDAAARLAGAETDLRQTMDAAAAAEREVERLTAALDRRKVELADEAAAIERELALVADKWQQAVRQRPADAWAGEPPAVPSVTAAAAARDDWARGRDADRHELDAARGWADGLEPLLEALPGRLLEAVNLVAATPAGLAADPHFGAGRRGPFDLVVIEEAHAVADGDLLAAARRARRWVLVGEPQPPSRRSSEPERQRGHLAGARPRTERVVGGFARLWDLLHYDPWAREGERVVCRLRLVPAADRSRLDREPVADRPDVELRIHTPRGGEPELAEVAFPPGTPVARAAEYVFQQLGELPAGADPRWEDTPDRLVARWRIASPSGTADLGDGVRAAVGDTSVAAVEFDPAAGWDRERAAAWVRRHAGRCGPGRTVRLDTPHRMTPGLAEVVGELLGVGSYSGPPSNGAPPCVEFVPVPGTSTGRNGQSVGAGLESDLADGRQRGRLPQDLADLPVTGLVNVTEARAVVRVLQQAGTDAGPVAVLALTAAQADLLRRLVRTTAGLPAHVVVTTPPEFRHREAGTVVVSLVRSHAHRAVPYGDEPDWLPLALGRGRRRLVLVGDPGTLARRAEWDGPLDHLDGPAARRERDLVHHLVRYLHGRGRFARAFRLCPGSPA